jgi:hypothetical protein
LNFTSGEDRPVAMTTHRLTLGMSASPDGRYLLFTQVDESGSDLMLIKDFRAP